MKRARLLVAICCVAAIIRRWRSFSTEYDRAPAMRNPMVKP